MNENVNFKKINEDMQRGYSFLMNDDSLSACKEWKKVWTSVVNALKAGEYQNIEDFDKEFNGEQSIYNWASDYEMELANASHEDIAFAKARIKFCTEYLKYISDTSENNSLNMKKAIAESLFQTGMAGKGENNYKKITKESPTWAWGWIGWADAYSSDDEHKNLEKSIEILEQAINIDGIEEKDEIMLRLQELYLDAGKVVIDDNVEDCRESINGLHEAQKQAPDTVVDNPVRKVKIGRNEKCPCGSGQKYKRCCGRNS